MLELSRHQSLSSKSPFPVIEVPRKMYCSSPGFPFVGVRLVYWSLQCTATFVICYHWSLLLAFSLHCSSSSAFLRSLFTQSSHLSCGLPRFLQPSLSSFILTMCPAHFIRLLTIFPTIQALVPSWIVNWSTVKFKLHKIVPLSAGRLPKRRDIPRDEGQGVRSTGGSHPGREGPRLHVHPQDARPRLPLLCRRGRGRAWLDARHQGRHRKASLTARQQQYVPNRF